MDAWVSVFETFLDKYGWPTLVVVALWRGWLVIGTEARSWKEIALRGIEQNERLAGMAAKVLERRNRDEAVDLERRGASEEEVV